MSTCRVVLFGDPQGIPQLLKCLGDAAEVVGIMQASIRPGQGVELQALAAKANAPLMVQPRWREADYPGFVGGVKALAPDLFLINSYSMILRPDLLAVPGRGTINVHGALLPHYRGASVTEWAIINEERTTGATMHVVDAGIDTGPIVGRVTVPLGFADTWADARKSINEATSRLLADTMPAILAGRYSAVPQSEGRHWPRRSASDGRFRWNQPLRQIYNLVRALVAPHPGAFWENPDGTTGTLDRWVSLPALAVLKAIHAGAWRHEGVLLAPRAAAQESQRAVANARIAFDVLDASGAMIGAATLNEIDCYGGSAGAALRGCGVSADRVASALRSFLHDELQISRLDLVQAAR